MFSSGFLADDTQFPVSDDFLLFLWLAFLSTVYEHKSFCHDEKMSQSGSSNQLNRNETVLNYIYK